VAFARQEFFHNQKEPWNIHEGTVVGRHVFACLLDARENSLPVTDYKNSFTIVLSDTLAKKGPTLTKLSKLICILEEQFKLCLLIHINGQTALGESRWRAIENFLDRYGANQPKNMERFYQWAKRRSAKPLRLNQNKFANG
jgi:hypothetical protein